MRLGKGSQEGRFGFVRTAAYRCTNAARFAIVGADDAPPYLTVHLWVGIIAAFFPFALGISGSIIAFENEIDQALNPKLTWIDSGQTRLTLAQTMEAENSLSRLRSGSRCSIGTRRRGLERLPDERDQRGPCRLFHPYDGAILGNEARCNNFTAEVHQFHLRLLAGKLEGNIVTAAAVLLLFRRSLVLCFGGRESF